MAHEIGSLKECNEKLSHYGPDNFKADRISVKMKAGQETAAQRNNMSLLSRVSIEVELYFNLRLKGYRHCINYV